MLLIANMGNPGEIGRRSLAARPFTRSGLRGVGRELLLDRRTVALEPVLHLHELAAFDRPDLHPAATLVVGRRELQRRYKAAQREAFDRLHALLDILRRRRMSRRAWRRSKASRWAALYRRWSSRRPTTRVAAGCRSGRSKAASS